MIKKFDSTRFILRKWQAHLDPSKILLDFYNLTLEIAIREWDCTLENRNYQQPNTFFLAAVQILECFG